MPADPAIEAAAYQVWKAKRDWLVRGGFPVTDEGPGPWPSDYFVANRTITAWLEAKAAEIFVPANEAEKHILPWLRTSAQALREGERE